MSFQEKNITVTLVSFTLILVVYLTNIFQMVQGGGLNSAGVFRLWGIVIVMAIIALGALPFVFIVLLLIVCLLKALKSKRLH